MIIKIFWIIRGIIYKLFFRKIGWMSYIGKPLYISGAGKVFLGKKVRIFPGARIEVNGKDAYIEIQDDVTIGQHLHLTSSGALIIEKFCTINADVMITNIDHEYRELGIPIVKQAYIVKETIIGQNSYIGMGARIQAGTILGKQCIVGANAVVRGKFPDYSVIAGIPAKVIKRYNINTKKWERTNSDGSFKENRLVGIL